MAVFTTLPPSVDLYLSFNNSPTPREDSLISTLSNNNRSDSNNTSVVDGCHLVYTKSVYIPWDNPENIFSQETTQQLIKIFLGMFTPFLAIVGMALNIIDGVVFCKQGLGERITLLLFCLAISDFLVEAYMLVHCLEYFYSQLEGNFQEYGPLKTFQVSNGLITFYGFVYVSGFISTVIACERWLCISHPFIAKKFLKTTTAGIIVFVATVILVGVHYIIGDMFRIGCVHYVHIGVTVRGLIPSAFYLKHQYLVDVLSGVVYGLFLPLFFTILISITTSITAVKLKTAAAWRQQMTVNDENKKKEVAVTKMLIAVSILFVVCIIPNIVVRIVSAFVADFRLGGRYQNLFLSGIIFINLTPAVNSCVNFFFYFHMGSKFRVTLKRLCFRLKKREIEEVSVAGTSTAF